MYTRAQYHTLLSRLSEPRNFIQVVMGPRQIGKTTTVRQVLKTIESRIPYLFYSADDVPTSLNSWISDCWSIARVQMKMQGADQILLIIDEIQKLKGWSEVVKKEWDNDTFNELNIKVVLLGSSRVLLQKGLADSLAGRFETIKMTHWDYSEMRDAFDLSLEQYIYFGGYPGAVPLLQELDRWKQYIKESIIDATINKDILYDTLISKPALLRQTFELGASYSGEIVSLTKMVGSLQDAGNTTTLSGYLNILKESGLLAGIQKYSVDQARRRASIPKFQVLNNALRNAYAEQNLPQALTDNKSWGRYFESAIGAFLMSNAFVGNYDVYYYREGNIEVDYILIKENKMVAIEVKSGNDRHHRGLEEIRSRFAPHTTLLVGKGGMEAEKFLTLNPSRLFE